MLLAPRSGSGESTSFVKIDKNWLLRTSAFPLAFQTVQARRKQLQIGGHT